ncbi:MAG TPA: calcium/proton exchanger [Chloroflexota bacterium]|nr:calcium/proton exchanger [Chloroflexota bacterium]
MSRPILVLLLLVPLAIFGEALGLPHVVLFFVALGAVVPLAAVISAATEQAALAKGPRIGGLLNATFGNVPDLFVGYFGVRAGLLPFVKATLIGGIISNTGLVIGLAFLVAGLAYGFPRFDAREAGRHTVLLLLAISGLLLPTLLAATSPAFASLLELSVGVSIILLLAYLAFVAFSVFGLVGNGSKEPEDLSGGVQILAAAEAEAMRPVWSFPVAVGVLLTAAAALALVTDVLVNTVTPTVHALGWTDTFVGLVLVANAGNAAEMYAAVAMARKGRLDLLLGIASGSSIQIATFVAPLTVLISLFLHPMTLTFTVLQIAILGVVVAIFSQVAQDGETNWLEGFQLLAIYAMAAAVFFFV